MTRLVRVLAALSCVVLLPSSGRAGIRVDAVQELELLGKGIEPPRQFGNVAFRVAVFSFEDPDELDLGNALASLASHEVLAGALVDSIGVLRYEGRLTPEPGETRGYFDKVELLARHQEPTAALWGMVRRSGEDLTIETWLQLPTRTLTPGLMARLTMPRAMGGGELRATAGADRLLLQRLRLPLGATEMLRQSAGRLGELRTLPSLEAEVAARVPMGTVFYLVERRGGWVRMAVAGGPSGWVPLSGHCKDGCSDFLEGPRLLSETLAFIQRRRAPATRYSSLSQDAWQLRDMLAAMVALDRAGGWDAGAQVLESYGRWLPPPGSGIAEAPPLGAGCANLRLLARMADELRQERAWGGPPYERYDQVRLREESVLPIVHEAAEAAAFDPRNPDLLHNLQVLYTWLGDAERASLAARLLEQSQGAVGERW